MEETRSTGTGLGMTYIFAKTFVHDLEAMATFYEDVFGLVRFGTHQDEMLGRKIEEVMYQASYPGGPALTLIKYVDSTGPIAGEAVQGFMSDDLEALVERALAHGGSVPDPIRIIPAYNIKVVFVLDPEGHIIEVIQTVS